jgi:large subunit ribosomal protein L11
MAEKKKQPDVVIKLQIPAGKATPAPPLGPALGQHGVAIMDFCKAYNDATKDKMGDVIPVEIYVKPDKSFTFKLKTPPTSQLLLKAVGKKSGSAVPNRDKIAKITRKQLEEIATIKMPDINANDMDAAVQIIAGSARSMGIEVVS